MENAVVIKTPPENSGTNNGQFRRGNPFRFPPGRSGNPGGRPRRRISEALADDLEKTIPSTPEIIALCRDLRLSRRSTWAQLVARVLLNRSLNELDAAREVCDRVEGKARTPIELGGSEKRDIHIHVTHEDSPTRE